MASRGVNKVILIGHLGRDPEVRQLKSGNAVCNLSLATTRKRRDQETDSYIDETEWHRVVLFGRNAEVAEKYLHKGSQIYIEGRLQTRKWKDGDGNERWSTEVISYEMTMLGGGSGGGGGGGGGNRRSSSGNTGNAHHGDSGGHDDNYGGPPDSGGDGFDDDVPF